MIAKRNVNNLKALHWEDSYKHKSWLPKPCVPQLPHEPICKSFSASLGMFVELFIELKNHKTTVYWQLVNIFQQPPAAEKVQHCTTYSFFLLSSIMDLVTMGTSCRFLKKTGQILFACALCMGGTLFLFHIGRWTTVDARHFILSLSFYGVALTPTIFFSTKVFVTLILSARASCFREDGLWQLDSVCLAETGCGGVLEMTFQTNANMCMEIHNKVLLDHSSILILFMQVLLVERPQRMYMRSLMRLLQRYTSEHSACPLHPSSFL